MTAETIAQFAARVCDKIVTTLYADAYPSNPVTVATGILRDELATLPPRVVEVTRDDLHQCCSSVTLMDSDAQAHAEAINESLRARAPLPAPRPTVDVEAIIADFKGTHGGELLALNDYSTHRMNIATADLREVLRRHVTDTGWITVPTTQTAGDLVAPETGWYLVKWATLTDWSLSPTWKTGGVEFNAGVAAVRLWDTGDGSTGPLIERQPTTTRAWTAAAVPEGHILAELPQESPDAPDGAVYCFHRMVRRVQVADQLNTLGAVRIYAVIPQDGPR